MKKTKLMKKLAKKMGWKVVDLKLSKRRPIDLRGLPDLRPVDPAEVRAVYAWVMGEHEDENELIWSGWRTWNRRV